MKSILPLLGVLLSIVGVIWILQGINILPGSFMTGVPFWAFAGLVALIVGIGLIASSVRSRRKA